MNYVEKMMRDAKKEKQKQVNKEHRKQMKKIDALINKANAFLKK